METLEDIAEALHPHAALEALHPHAVLGAHTPEAAHTEHVPVADSMAEDHPAWEHAPVAVTLAEVTQAEGTSEAADKVVILKREIPAMTAGISRSAFRLALIRICSIRHLLSSERQRLS